MIRATSILGAAALGLSALPAQAQTDAFTTGAAAYEDSAAEAVPIESAEDTLLCAGYWRTWTLAVSEGVVTPAQLAQLPDDLKPPQSELASVAYVLGLEESDQTSAELTKLDGEVRGLIAKTQGGDDQAAFDLFDILGACPR
jgi:hypothetical protein